MVDEEKAVEVGARFETRELAGTGGTFDASPADFSVEELPLYEAVGDGEHLYVRFEKRGLTTRDVLRAAMRTFDLPEADVGYAGLKDKHATTIQTISLRGVAETDAARLEGEGVRVLSARKHRNKLRVGHLAGNRFRLRVRGVDPAAAARATAILGALTARGLPNFYGQQRFGVAGDNVAEGMEVVRRGGRGVPHWKAKLLVSSLQSALFNEVLARRMAGGTHRVVLAGDFLQKVDSGGAFLCTDPAVDGPRFERFEVSITGPIFGAEMRAAEGEPGRLEAEVLAQAQLARDDFKRVAKFAPGTRRALRAKVEEARAELDDDGLVVSFRLPPGSYATVLVDEVMKPVAPLAESD